MQDGGAPKDIVGNIEAPCKLQLIHIVESFHTNLI
jgi:hypothetical protein